MEQRNLFIGNGFNLVEMWECQWCDLKNTLDNKEQLETNANNQNIVIRDALFGGRTEGFKSYVSCNENQFIGNRDVVSLYPTVNALDDYAVGYGSYVNYNSISDFEQDLLSGKFFGVAKVDITPPTDLYVPVLPDNSDHKLLFHLNPMKSKTFASVELKLAVEKGYKIDKLHAALKYDRYNGLMKKYVEFFLEMKIKNTKAYTQEECDEINKTHKDMGFTFVIKPEETCKNKGLRAVAKLCLNSLWGKFGQRCTLDSYEYISEWSNMLLQLNNEHININSWHILNDNCVEIRFKEKQDYTVEAEYISEITAVFTTANARVRLYSMLDWLHPSQIIYCDTDSVIFIYDKTNPLHKCPSNDSHRPSNIVFGDALGCWENEFKGNEYIKEIVVSGAKSYSYIKYDPDTDKTEYIIKQKGITLDVANSNIFNYEDIRTMVLENKTLESEKRYMFSWNSHTKDIQTQYLSRSVRNTIDSKRMVVDGYDTRPFGFVDTN
jgi:hypothetical protein